MNTRDKHLKTTLNKLYDQPYFNIEEETALNELLGYQAFCIYECSTVFLNKKHLFKKSKEYLIRTILHEFAHLSAVELNRTVQGKKISKYLTTLEGYSTSLISAIKQKEEESKKEDKLFNIESYKNILIEELIVFHTVRKVLHTLKLKSILHLEKASLKAYFKPLIERKIPLKFLNLEQSNSFIEIESNRSASFINKNILKLR